MPGPLKINRRAFLQSLAASVCAASLARSATQDRRPNILIIVADDMGYSDIGCYGGEINTPNLDALARGGMRFTQFYNAARCCPTRACLLTGLYPHQAGVGDMVANRGLPAYQGYLNDSCVTIAEALGAGGYHTLMSGKWHIGEQKGNWPVDRGFERHYGLISGASSYWKVDKGRTFVDNDKVIDPAEDPNFYATDAYADRAVQFIGEFSRKPDPFFLYVPFTAPHWPLHARPEDIARYRGKYTQGWDKLREQRHRRMVELGILDESVSLSPRDAKARQWDSLTQKEKEEMDLKQAVYAAQIDRMDQGIGRIIAKLKETGQFDNTLIFFFADNGGCHEGVNRNEEPDAPIGTKGSYQSYGLPWANASNTPFRMFKHWVHEGGISSPLIVHWPGHVKAGAINRTEVTHLIDIMPTVLAASGAAYPAERKGRKITPLEGKSLLPVLEGRQREPHQAIFWEHEGNKAVRAGQWKLVSADGGKWELYDMSVDRAELNNLAAKMPEKVAELSALYDAWAKRAGVVDYRELNRKKPA